MREYSSSFFFDFSKSLFIYFYSSEINVIRIDSSFKFSSSKSNVQIESDFFICCGFCFIVLFVIKTSLIFASFTIHPSVCRTSVINNLEIVLFFSDGKWTCVLCIFIVEKSEFMFFRSFFFLFFWLFFLQQKV